MKDKQTNTTPVVNMVGKVNKHNDWVDGSGATEHIICNKEFLENATRNTVETLVRIPNGDHIHIEGFIVCNYFYKMGSRLIKSYIFQVLVAISYM